MKTTVQRVHNFSAGPAVMPMYWAPERVLRLEFSRDSGTLTLRKATAGAMIPEKTPETASAIVSCHGAVISPVMAPVRLER